METVGLSGQNGSHLDRNVVHKQVKAFQRTLNAFRAKNHSVCWIQSWKVRVFIFMDSIKTVTLKHKEQENRLKHLARRS